MLRIPVLAFVASSLLAVEAPPVPVIDAGGSGRFVFKQVGSMRADMFMVDTKTGRIWQMVNSGPEDQKKLVLQPIAYVGVNGAMPMPEDTLSEVMVEMGKSKAAHPELGGMFDYMMRSIAGMSEEEFKKGNPQTQPAKKP